MPIPPSLQKVLDGLLLQRRGVLYGRQLGWVYEDGIVKEFGQDLVSVLTVYGLRAAEHPAGNGDTLLRANLLHFMTRSFFDHRATYADISAIRERVLKPLSTHPWRGFGLDKIRFTGKIKVDGAAQIVAQMILDILEEDNALPVALPEWLRGESGPGDGTEDSVGQEASGTKRTRDWEWESIPEDDDGRVTEKNSDSDFMNDPRRWRYSRRVRAKTCRPAVPVIDLASEEPDAPRADIQDQMLQVVTL
jgi:hypothetical protein